MSQKNRSFFGSDDHLLILWLQGKATYTLTLLVQLSPQAAGRMIHDFRRNLISVVVRVIICSEACGFAPTIAKCYLACGRARLLLAHFQT